MKCLKSSTPTSLSIFSFVFSLSYSASLFLFSLPHLSSSFPRPASSIIPSSQSLFLRSYTILPSLLTSPRSALHFTQLIHILYSLSYHPRHSKTIPTCHLCGERKREKSNKNAKQIKVIQGNRFNSISINF